MQKNINGSIGSNHIVIPAGTTTPEGTKIIEATMMPDGEKIIIIVGEIKEEVTKTIQIKRDWFGKIY